MDEESLEHGLWYPDEDICNNQRDGFTSLKWVARQRKIARRVKDASRFFTYKILCRNCVITQTMKGLDPDRPCTDREKDEQKWLKEHPQIVVTEAMRERSQKAAGSFRGRVKKSA
jgi:hypothetical protein